MTRRLLPALTTALVTTCGWAAPPETPVTIRLVTAEGVTGPLVEIRPYDGKLEASAARGGQYLLLVRMDGEPHYERLIGPEEIESGTFKDLRFPGAGRKAEWTVALERLVSGKTTAAVSNTISFDPLNPAKSAEPVPTPTRGEVRTEIGPAAGGFAKYAVGGKDLDLGRYASVEAALGPPDRTVTGPRGGKTWVWDARGISAVGDGASVDKLILHLEPPEAGRLPTATTPRRLFSGTVSRRGREAGPGSTRDDFDAVGLWTRADPKTGVALEAQLSR